MEKMLKVGVMPGRIQELAVEEGMTLREVLKIAELDSTGYEVKVDGNVVGLDYEVDIDDNLVLLVRQIKGNADGVIKIGVMPGRIQEIVVAPGTTVSEVIQLAELDSSGYEIKVDGTVVGLDYAVKSSDNLILLVRQIKGNKLIKKEINILHFPSNYDKV